MQILTSAMAGGAWAIARPHHQHEDLFDEDDLLFGFKLGPQVTSFTPVQTGPAVVPVESSMRFIGGASVKFVYGLPRFELDLFWNARGWVNTPDTVNSLSIPILGKIPFEIDKGLDFEFGVGIENDFPMFGADPHGRYMLGVLGSAGLSIDFVSFVVDFDVRYNVGTSNVSSQINGAANRDFQAIGGILWHF